jgi:hypothetical protein
MKGKLIATYGNFQDLGNGRWYYHSKPATVTTVDVDDCTVGETGKVADEVKKLKGTSTLVSVVLVREDLTHETVYTREGDTDD